VADRFLAGDPVGAIVGENARNYSWDELRDAYAAKLGIEAGARARRAPADRL
jgi:hypothetical protein